MPRTGEPRPLQNTHEYTHTLTQKEEMIRLGRKLTHISCAHIHIGAQRTHVYKHEHTHTHLLVEPHTANQTSKIDKTKQNKINLAKKNKHANKQKQTKHTSTCTHVNAGRQGTIQDIRVSCMHRRELGNNTPG